jgi:hypothetical protein
MRTESELKRMARTDEKLKKVNDWKQVYPIVKNDPRVDNSDINGGHFHIEGHDKNGQKVKNTGCTHGFLCFKTFKSFLTTFAVFTEIIFLLSSPITFKIVYFISPLIKG